MFSLEKFCGFLMTEPIMPGGPWAIVLLKEEFFEPKFISGCFMKGVEVTVLFIKFFLFWNSDGRVWGGTIFGRCEYDGSVRSAGFGRNWSTGLLTFCSKSLENSEGLKNF